MSRRRIQEPRPLPPPQERETRSLSEVRQSQKLLEAVVAERRLQVEKQTLEGLMSDYWDFGGSDVWFEMRTGGPQHWMPPSVPGDRRHGGQWPVWRWDQELDRMRNLSRMISVQNPYARGLIKNNTNYVIGKGYAYKTQPAKELPAAITEETAEAYAKAVQEVVDDFLRRNRWNGLCDPKEQKSRPTGTREREGYRRTIRDGETLIRFFFLEDAKTEVRFMEPEQLRNPGRGPDGESGTWQNGWSYGIRHKMNPEDTETPEYYHFVFKDLATASYEEIWKKSKRETDDPKRSPVGEFVPAHEVVHIKHPDEDMAVKRGMPAFAFETADAFIRASKLVKFVSSSATVRAATAEIWKHTYGTQAQISQLSQGIPSKTELDPLTMQPQNLQRVYPGMIRRVPFGQEPVAIPENNATTQQLEAVQADVRQGGAAFCAPEYLASGDASNANYASTKEAGAPYVNNAEAEQEHFKAAYGVCIWKAVWWAVECGTLPAEVMDCVEIQIEAPQVVHTDGVQKAQEDQILVGIGAKSPQSCAMERGLDPDHEMQNLEEYHERMGSNGNPLALPDDNGNMPGGEGQRPPTLESLLEAWSEQDHPRGQPKNAGQFGKGGGGKPKKKSDGEQASSEAEITVKPTKERAFQGKPIATKTELSKQETGKIGESIVIAWLKSKGFKDARHLNTEQNNYAIDLIQDHESIEAKTGLVSVNAKSQRWRLSIGEPGKAEKAWLAKASAKEKASWNANKQKAIHARKKKALAEVSKAVGRPVKASTVTLILNPDTKTADIYKFDGWHDYIGWNSPAAKAAYVGSVSYGSR